MDRRTNARLAWYLAFFEIVGAGWDFPDRYARAIEAVTAADVARAAERYLTRPTHRRAPADARCPAQDDVPSRAFPFVTVGLVGLNVLVFLYQVSVGMGGDPRAAEAIVLEFGATPCRLTGACPVPGEFPSPVATIFTSMFLHGGLLHVGGNMLYLWIFGDNVEDTLGTGAISRSI